VVAEIAARPRPALDTAEHRQALALAIVREFKQRTGERMNNAEFARALGMRKADVVPIRAALQADENAA